MMHVDRIDKRERAGNLGEKRGIAPMILEIASLRVRVTLLRR